MEQGLFGLNVILKRGDEASLDRNIALLRGLSARIIRLELDWYEGVDTTIMERFVDRARAADIEILGLLTGLVPGTLGNLFGNARFRHPEDELEAYIAFVEQQARRYRGRIKRWEIWNEQNTARFWLRRPSARSYFAVLEAAATALRAIDAENQILLGSLCGNDVDFLAPGIPRRYLQELLELGAETLVDGYGIHPYSLGCYLSLRGRAATVAEIKKRVDHFQEQYPELRHPVWITEIGISRSWVRLNAGDIGLAYHELTEDFTARGMTTLLWCLQDFDDPCYRRGNPERSFGLVDTDLRPHESWHTLARLRGAPGAAAL